MRISSTQAAFPLRRPRTVLGLIDCGEDLSLVASVLRDALERGLVADVGKPTDEVDLRGKKAGAPKDESLYKLMTESK